MKIITTVAALVAAFTPLKWGVSKGTTLAILHEVHFAVEPNTGVVSATTTDLEKWIQVPIVGATAVCGESSGHTAFLAPFRLLNDLLKSLPKGRGASDAVVTLETNEGTFDPDAHHAAWKQENAGFVEGDGRRRPVYSAPSIIVTVTSGKLNTTLPALPVQEFPVHPHEIIGTTTAYYTVAAGEFLHGLGRVRHAASSDESRIILTGILLESAETANGERLRFTATDTHRLSLYTSAIELPAIVREPIVLNTKKTGKKAKGINPRWDTIPRSDALALLPIVSVAAIASIFPAKKHDASDFCIGVVRGRDNMSAQLTVHGTSPDSPRLTTRLLEGQYLNCRRVIPPIDGEATRPRFTAVRAELLDALEAVRSVAIAIANRVVFTVKGNRLTLSAESEHGATSTDIEIVSLTNNEGVHEDFQAAYNVKYVIDALKSFTGDSATWVASEALRPAILQDSATPGVEYVIMPMMILS